jgi:hypothetical protein
MPNYARYDDVIQNREINRLVESSKHSTASALIGAHFKQILLLIISTVPTSTSAAAPVGGVASSPVLTWTSDNANHAAFDVCNIALCV